MSRPENENSKERLEKTARELRKHRPRPSEALIARVERLAERGATRRSRPARFQLSRRRLVFALAAALAVATVGAIVHSEMQPSSKTAAHARLTQLHLLGADTNQQTAGASKSFKKSQPLLPQTNSGKAVNQYVQGVPTTESLSTNGSGDLADSAATSTTPRAGLARLTTGKRLADLRATLTLKVENRARLSSATAKAMRIVSSLGGYVAFAHYGAPARGVAASTLKFKVPARRAQKALSRISALGEILSQKVSLEDVQRTVAVERDEIKTLQRRIADLELSLSDGSLTASARSQLQVQLANARANLHSLQVQRSANVRRGRLATITLTLTTGDLPKTPSHPSRIHKAIDRAWNGLSSEISWAAMAIIVASPFLLLAAVLAVLVRFRKRREERRLLEK